MLVKIFFCYAHEDEPLLNKLKAHLTPLQRQGLIATWHDREISAGEEWEREIEYNLITSNIILLLLSPNFMCSDYCYDIEMQHALELHQMGLARVIPIILRPVDWKETPIAKLQVLPKKAKPITSWSNQEEAFEDVTQGIRAAVVSLLAQQEQSKSERKQWPFLKDERLKIDAIDMLHLIRKVNTIQIVSSEGNPPSRYIIRYLQKGIIRIDENNQPIIANEHHVGFDLQNNRYPLDVPSIYFLTPIFHPNIYQLGSVGSSVCIGWFRLPCKLSDLIVQIARMIDYQVFETNSSANIEAARWAAQNLSQFPLQNWKLPPGFVTTQVQLPRLRH